MDAGLKSATAIFSLPHPIEEIEIKQEGKMKKSTIWAIGFLGATLLAFTVFVAGRMMNNTGGSWFFAHHEIHPKPAAELPPREADVIGIFVRREANRVFVGTGNIKFDTSRSDDPAATPVFESSF